MGLNKSTDLWSSLPMPAYILDQNACIQQVNAAAEGFFNVSAKSQRGAKFFHQIQIETSLEQSFEQACMQMASLSLNDIDLSARHRTGLRCTLQLVPLVGSDHLMLVLINPQDFLQIMGSNGNVKSAAKSAIGMAQMLAHEIKNPLAGITGAAQLIGMNASVQDLELTDLIVDESRRIVKLLDQVEQFGNLSVSSRLPFNLHDVLERARQSAILGFGSKMNIIEDYDPSLPLAFGDSDQMLQVVLNLLKNATEAAIEQSGTIRLRSYYDHGFRMSTKTGERLSLPLQIEVIDDGPGLPDGIKDAIFDPFVSGRENGSGLGLALVSKIILEHNAWISVSSEPGNTRFRISLPRADKSV